MRAAMRATPLVRRRFWRKANSSTVRLGGEALLELGRRLRKVVPEKILMPLGHGYLPVMKEIGSDRPETRA